MLRVVNGLGGGAGGGIMPGQTLTRIINEALGGSSAQLPEVFVWDVTDPLLLQIFLHAQPAVFAAGPCPKCVVGRRIPGRVMNAVRDVADRDFIHRPARKKR